MIWVADVFLYQLGKGTAADITSGYSIEQAGSPCSSLVVKVSMSDRSGGKGYSEACRHLAQALRWHLQSPRGRDENNLRSEQGAQFSFSEWH